MRTSFVISAALAASIVSAAPLDKRESKGYVSLDVAHKKNLTAFSDRHSKRSLGPIDIKNKFYYYEVTLEAGTPGQSINVLLDTGSSDLWFYDSSVTGVDSTYDSSASSTYSYNNSDFSIQYVSGSASGDWATDTVALGSASLTSQTIGVDKSDGSGTSVFGIGLETNEASEESSDPVEYVNVPQNLVNQGYTKRNVYSLFLDDINAASGSILFGAVDSDKYTGELYTVPLQSTNAFSVDASVSYNGKTAGSFQGILDSGTSFTYIPDSAVSTIASEYGATWDSDLGAYTLSSLPSEGIEFNFSGATIKVPADEIWVPASELGASGDDYVFLVFPYSQASDYVLLGDSFLRSAYVVYDLDNLELSIAQASYSSSSNIKIVTDGIPGAETAPGL